MKEKKSNSGERLGSDHDVGDASSPSRQSVNPFDRTLLKMSVGHVDLPDLQRLPWYKPLADWKKSEAKLVQIKSGLSRHPVRFVRSRRKAFAIKETSVEAAEKEYASYIRLRQLGIPTLMPVGTVIRGEGVAAVQTGVGTQLEHRSTGYVITQLLEYSIPHYFLFRRAFQKANRLRMWDTIVRLFVQLHCKGVYWGDASLSNMMMVFAKQHFPEIGIRTHLRAVLADAETVEFYPQLSDRMRLADLESFLESMEWTEADLKASGVLRDPLMTAEDRIYISTRYRDLFAIEREEQTFELLTNIDVEKLLGPFQERGQSKALLQHIYEHKWYISERDGKEITIEEAARDWYMDVFKPVLILFGEFSILDEFPDRTAASLYLDIMLHKYYLSEKVGKDVGLVAAFESYSRQLTDKSGTMKKMLDMTRSMKELFGRKKVLV